MSSTEHSKTVWMKKINQVFLFLLSMLVLPVYADKGAFSSETERYDGFLISKANSNAKQKTPAVPKVPSAKDFNDKYDNLPIVPLTADLAYSILTAEVATQRAQQEVAYDILMQTAEKTRDPRLAKRATEVAALSKQQDATLDAIRLWYKLAPTSVEAEKFYLGFLSLYGKLDEIGDFYAQKLAHAPENQRFALFFQLQQFLASAKDKSEAYNILERVVEPYKQTYDGHITMAVACVMISDKAQAKQHANVALSLKPDSDTAILTLAQVANTTNEAISILENYLKNNPNSIQVRSALARVFVSLKRYDEAKNHFQMLLLNDPDNRQAMYALSILAIERHNNKLAIQYLERYIHSVKKITKKGEQADQQTVQVLFLLAELSAESREYNRALYWLNQIDVDGDEDADVSAKIKQAQVYAAKGNMTKTRQIISDLRSKYTDESEKLFIVEAQILREAKQINKAFILLEKAVKVYPKSANLLYDYALTAELIKQYNVMENALKQVVVIDPSFAQAYNALGYSYADRNINLDQAERLLTKAMQLSPDDPYITDSWGWLLYRQGKLEQSEQYLRKAAILHSQSEIILHLSEVLWVQGKHDQAVELLRQVKQINPKTEGLIELIQRLGIQL